MKIWCFLCFGEENKERGEDMESGKLGDKSELKDSEDLELGFYLGLPGSSDGVGGGGGSKRELGGSVVERESVGFEGLGLSIGGSGSSGSRGFEHFPASSSGKRDVICGLELDEPSAVVDNENVDWDLQIKRAKVDVSSFQGFNCATAGSSIVESTTTLCGAWSCNDSQNHSIPLEDEMLCLPSSSMDGYNADPIRLSGSHID